MTFSLLSGSSFLTCLVIITLLFVGIVSIYFSQKITTLNHKFESTVDTINTLTEEIQGVKKQNYLLSTMVKNVSNSSSGPTSDDIHTTTFQLPFGGFKKIVVSEDEDEDDGEDDCVDDDNVDDDREDDTDDDDDVEDVKMEDDNDDNNGGVVCSDDEDEDEDEDDDDDDDNDENVCGGGNDDDGDHDDDEEKEFLKEVSRKEQNITRSYAVDIEDIDIPETFDIDQDNVKVIKLEEKKNGLDILEEVATTVVVNKLTPELLDNIFQVNPHENCDDNVVVDNDTHSSSLASDLQNYFKNVSIETDLVQQIPSNKIGSGSSISGAVGSVESGKYKKMNVQKLKEALLEKGYTEDVTNLKKIELVKILEGMAATTPSSSL